MKNLSSESDKELSTLDQPLIDNDTDLVKRAQNNDSFAQYTIYRKYAPYLINLSTKLTQRVNDADDIVQEAFIIAFDKINDLNNPASLKPWLIKILVHQVYRCFRRKKIRLFLRLDHNKNDTALDLLEANSTDPNHIILLQEINKKLQIVNPKHKTVWILHRLEGLSISETATAVNTSTATVKRYIASIDKEIELKRDYNS